MKNRNAFLILVTACLILSALGFLGLFLDGAFGQFVRGMTPGVLAGLSILMLIVLKDENK